ncbi:SpoIIIAH-like family protein [Paenactinomyces guangxiensis]|uniref:SpoIIIAH-like family protein n=1 Tax=Paenactinomyces guangxiensis TaxID=1490290 RepID=A0A7W2A8V2_9BACL|nr:SpoIIIAH-like family protein [Paenactinomyces guangxiensis]MBA4494990.1 SpoIIIAH-like family protein [Paenactinomyces guangxiensis]MBH8592073.1 SpoIIIAH-like family protein [Paenactinomyces guangxiensis]
MTMNKQTVWLVTMLSLMVVLSAYYIVTGPVEPVDQSAAKPDDLTKEGNIDVNIKTVEQPAEAAKQNDVKETLDKANDDYFVAYQLQRNTLRQKETERYMQVLTNPEASKEQLQEAKQKIDQLMKVDKTETVLEELIRKEGYSDAVVVTSDSHVDVVVQSDKLTNAQAVKLINLVKQHLNVSPTQVSVAYRP